MKKSIQTIFGIVCCVLLLGFAACATGPSAYDDTVTVDVEAGAADVAVDRVFTITFGAPIVTSTVTAESAFIVPEARSMTRSAYDVTTCDVNGAIDATVACASTTECSITPTNELDAGAAYNLCLTPAIQFEDSSLTFEGFTAAFTTATEAEAEAASSYSVGGTISGLEGTVVLQNNATDDLSITANGSFAFVTELADAATYAVTILTQPASQICTVANGTGTVSAADVTTVTVGCVTQTSTYITPDGESLIPRTLTQYRLYDADDVEHTEDAEWSSSDETVLTVSNTAGTKGLVTAVAAGSARVRAAYGGETASTLVTVIPGLEEVSGIAVSDGGTASIGGSNTSRNITIDRSMKAHIVWVSSTGPQIRYSRSSDLGLSFESSVRVDDGGATLSATVEPVIASSGTSYVYIAYLDTAGSIYLAKSTDSGDTWSSPVEVADSWGAGITKLSIAAHDEYLYVLANTSPLKMVVSNDYGVTASTVTTAFTVHAYEDVLVDPSNGDVYILQDDPSLYWAKSTDHGTTFGSQTHDATVNVYYSDYTISQLGSIFIAGSGMAGTGNAAYFDLGDLSITQVDFDASPSTAQASVAIDGLNIIHIVASVGGNVYLYNSDDNGATYTSELVVEGSTKPDIAPTTFVDGAPILYLKDNAIFYSFVRDE